MYDKPWKFGSLNKVNHFNTVIVIGEFIAFYNQQEFYMSDFKILMKTIELSYR